jgi:ADP-heptose:LPS heptosyltransferase
MMLPTHPETRPDGATLPGVGYGTLSLRRVLVVQTQRLGDVVCAAPLFSALRNALPSAHLTALVHRPQEQLLAEAPWLDEVIAYDRQTTHRSPWARLGLIGELRTRGFDWALSIHAASSVAFALSQSGIPWRTCVWRYGDRKKPAWSRWFHQHIRQDRLQGAKHEIEHNLDVLRALGIDPEPDRRRIYVSEPEAEAARALLAERGREEERPLAVVHPGHGGGRQVWPPERYAAVADGLAERGFQVAVTGGPAEIELGRAVTGAMRAPSVPLAGELSLRMLCAVLAEARLFVSVPTGPMHLASALGVPVVALYGPTDLAVDLTRFCPYGSPWKAVVSPIACTCLSSHRCTAPVCMAGITPTMVLDACPGVELCG